MRWQIQEANTLYIMVIQKAVNQAIRDVGITKHANCNTFRHFFLNPDMTKGQY